MKESKKKKSDRTQKHTMRKKTKKTFTVSMAVDGRVDVTVEADTPEEAFDKATDAFMDVNLGDLDDVVDSRPVNATDDTTGELTDY